VTIEALSNQALPIKSSTLTLSGSFISSVGYSATFGFGGYLFSTTSGRVDSCVTTAACLEDFECPSGSVCEDQSCRPELVGACLQDSDCGQPDDFIFTGDISTLYLDDISATVD